jgi:hypothetical protein
MSHDIRGIKHLELSDIPATIDSVLPLEPPDPITGRDRDQHMFKDGVVYTWSDGNKGSLHGGVWRPERRPNPLCDTATK